MPKRIDKDICQIPQTHTGLKFVGCTHVGIRKVRRDITEKLGIRFLVICFNGRYRYYGRVRGKHFRAVVMVLLAMTTIRVVARMRVVTTVTISKTHTGWPRVSLTEF